MYVQVVRHYHGHLSGVYCMSLHPTIDALLTGGRDATARVWDMRTKACIHTLSGHTNTVADVLRQAPNPQVGYYYTVEPPTELDLSLGRDM